MANQCYVVVSVPCRPELNTYFAAKEVSVVQKPQVFSFLITSPVTFISSKGEGGEVSKCKGSHG